jgi:hypothetical protein
MEVRCPGRWSLLYVLEAHKSGIPHIHYLMVWSDRSPDINSMRSASDESWVGACARRGIRGMGNLSYISLRDVESRAFYMSKISRYASKESEHSFNVEFTGRMWGVKRKAYLPIDLKRATIPFAVAMKAARVLRKLSSRKSTVGFYRQCQDSPPTIERGSSLSRLFADPLVRKSARRAGATCSVSRRSFMSRREVELLGTLSEVVGPKSADDRIGSFVPLGVEVHNYYASSFPVRSSEVERLLLYLLSERLPS